MPERDSNTLAAIKNAIATKLDGNERGLLRAWLLVTFDVRGYALPAGKSEESD